MNELPMALSSVAKLTSDIIAISLNTNTISSSIKNLTIDCKVIHANASAQAQVEHYQHQKLGAALSHHSQF